MATAKKLPSGSWRCQVFSHTENKIKPDGSIIKKNVYKSFTVSDPTPKGKRKCEQLAAEWAARKESEPTGSLSFGQAVEQYISSRENVLSPRSIMDYRSTQRNHIEYLEKKDIYKITQADIQTQINLAAASVSPKTIRNIHGLISAVMRVYRPDFALNTALPKKEPPKLYIPSEDEIQRLMKAVEGTELEIPVLLAAFGTMRRGEICALQGEDINGNVAHVHSNMVRSADGKTYITKLPKSYAGDRYIILPQFIIDKLPKRGRVTQLYPDLITYRFRYCLKSNNLPHFRFHDLRHYSASILHAIGIPDSYIMERGGWGNDGTLKAVYRHALSDQSEKMQGIANDYFDKLYHTKYHTK